MAFVGMVCLVGLAAAIGTGNSFYQNRASAVKLCDFCGRDPRFSYHDGWNGVFHDDEMACKGIYESVYQDALTA